MARSGRPFRHWIVLIWLNGLTQFHPSHFGQPACLENVHRVSVTSPLIGKTFVTFRLPSCFLKRFSLAAIRK